MFFNVLAICILCITVTIFLKIALKISNSIDSLKNSKKENIKIDKSDELFIDGLHLPSFQRGIMEGVNQMQVSLFKVWEDNNEMMITGNYNELRVDMLSNLNSFFTNRNLMKEWNNKFSKFIEKDKNNNVDEL